MPALVRGSTVFFDALCVDATGSPVTPQTANLYLVFNDPDGARTKATVAMSVSGNTVSATWDSSAAGDGAVIWSIKAVGSDKFVQDGSLMLTANEANAD